MVSVADSIRQTANKIRLGDIPLEQYTLPPSEVNRLKSPKDYTDAIIEELRGETTSGWRLPWRDHDMITFRPGELTIWAGVNGHGKSNLLGYITLGFADQGAVSVVASLEMMPVKTLTRMVRQAVGPQPEERWVHKFAEKVDGYLYLYDRHGRMTPELAQALTRYSREEVEADHIIIDSLTKCGIGVDDYNGQKEFVDWLASYARDSGIHVHLVCHSRKKDNDTSPMNKFDVRGAGEITDLADNVCIVWQNQTPEHKRDEGDPDGMLIVDKQRHSRLKGRILLWYDEAWQFHPHEQHKRQDILHLWT